MLPILFTIVFTSATLQPVPLIGGPSYLPLHVQILLEEDSGTNTNTGDSVPYLLDFVPAEASDLKTLAALLSLSPVPGAYRFRPLVRHDSLSTSLPSLLEYEFSSPLTSDDIDTFISSCEPNLHLLKNNCWSFAFKFKAWSSESRTIDER
mmetsp:Transcript_13591/g.27016  ORF Transcript_13591/g.27016 Transcript_13591/m.27016 type:complete len:150 (+) Transcript_13591:148-597(+)